MTREYGRARRRRRTRPSPNRSSVRRARVKTRKNFFVITSPPLRRRSHRAAGASCLAAFAAAFAAFNQHHAVIDLWPLDFHPSIPVFLIVLVALGFGFLLGGLVVYYLGGPNRALRREVAGLEGDRFLAPDLAAAEQVVTSGALVTAVEKKVGPLAV